MTGSRHPPRAEKLSRYAPALLSVVPPRTPEAATGPVPALRAATRTHHDRVDRLMDLRRLRDPAHYARVLQAFDAFLAVWEDRVIDALPPTRHAWLRKRSRHAFLRQDLRVLGIAPLACAVALPVLGTAAAAWGSIYVMEGSALGGQVIARTLAHAGVPAQSGAAYFHGWGDATGAMWKETRTLLDQELASPAGLAQGCRAACATFDALSLLLESHIDERTAAA